MNWFSSTTGQIGIWLLTLAMVIGAQRAFAQQNEVPAGNEPAAAEEAEAAPATANQPPAENSRMLDIFVKMDIVGWIFMGVLMMFSLFGTTIALERLVNLTRNKMIPPPFERDLAELVSRQSDDPLAFQDVAKRYDAPVANILAAATLRSGRTLAEVEKGMEDAAAKEMSALRGRNRPLSVVGSVAPLVGLLGTVFGMIMAFRTASQGDMGKAEVLAEGIYLALLTTAAGLTIAIPALIVVAFLNARVERYMREMDEQMLSTLPSFARMEQQGSLATPAETKSEELVAS